MIASKVKSFIKTILPSSLYKFIKEIYLRFFKPVLNFPRKQYLRSKVNKIYKEQEKSLNLVRKKNKVTVAFFFLIADSWKYDSLYNEFKKHPVFEPVVVVCPIINNGEEHTIKELKKSEKFCIQKGYKYLLGYSIEERRPIDIKSILQPDIVFFSNPNIFTSKEYLIDNYLTSLTCYVPYTFQVDSLYDYRFNNKMANACWRVFYETDIHKRYARKYALNKGENVIVTGHPFLNIFRNKNGDDPWKNIDTKNRKKIIWGPHWTVKGGQESGLNFSCFLEYADYFFELAQEFEDQVQFAFKPHPLLKYTLFQEKLWGKEKTEKYYNSWDQGVNTQLLEGEFVQLFKYSDGLIHDSSAFLAEYHLLNKPSAYTIFNEEVFNTLNEFGINSLKVHTQIKSKIDLRRFIINIIEEVDEMKEQRNTFVDNFYYENQSTASENIVEYIKGQIQ